MCEVKKISKICERKRGLVVAILEANKKYPVFLILKTSRLWSANMDHLKKSFKVFYLFALEGIKMSSNVFLLDCKLSGNVLLMHTTNGSVATMDCAAGGCLTLCCEIIV